MTSTFWIIAAFVLYAIVMIVIGAVYSRKTSSAEDYFLGGRGLSGAVGALSAQASDMSGWLLMGLPGAVYIAGTGEIWVAVGLFIGTLLNWLIISKRFRRYTIRANNSITLSEYFKNRFHDGTNALLLVASIFTVIFFLVYTASAFSSGAKLFNTVFGLDYHVSLLIGAVLILIYTFLGGFMAVSLTDFIQGMIMLVAILAVPIIIMCMMEPGAITANLAASGVEGGVANYLNPLKSGESDISAVTIISGLAWGLGYCGMPHILARFMAIRSERELKKSKIIANVWVFISLGMACVLAVVGRAYLFGDYGVLEDSENVFIIMIKQLFLNDLSIPFIAGLFLCAILAAIMSTADSQLLVTASAVSKDIYADCIKKGKADEKNVLMFSKITVVIVTIIAFFIAWNPNSSVMGLVSDAWAGFGATFGPVVVLSLFWKKMTTSGALAGMIAGGVTVIVWDYIPFVNGQTLGSSTGLYSLILGFVIALIAIVLASKLSKKGPHPDILQEFEDVKVNNIPENQEA